MKLRKFGKTRISKQVEDQQIYVSERMLTVQPVSSDYVVTKEDAIIVNASSGNITITLPQVTSYRGKFLRIKKIDSSANTVTIDAYESELIDGEQTYVLENQFSAVTILSDGNEWRVFA